jgi:tRNA-Thr(GGU) m(6)t(6)A37 methyltransferase TsaA
VIAFEPIGVAHTPWTEKRQAPRQPAAARGVRATIELFAGKGYEDALANLEEWSHLWVLFAFDRSRGWSPKVLPPRSRVKKGLFATRAPHRPNPIGMSLVRLRSVEGLVVHVEDVDLLDGTPVLDLKPYVKYTDFAGDAGDGWLAVDPVAPWAVSFSVGARAELAFLAARGVELEDELRAALALGPEPHAYRRIKRTGDRGLLALKEWRAEFVVRERRIQIVRIRTGWRARELATRADLRLHRDFEAEFSR